MISFRWFWHGVNKGIAKSCSLKRKYESASINAIEDIKIYNSSQNSVFPSIYSEKMCLDNVSLNLSHVNKSKVDILENKSKINNDNNEYNKEPKH